jgi:hypothetical protein
VRIGLTLIVFVLNVAAIASILGARIDRGRKLGWCAAVVLLPFVGALGWLLTDRARPRAALHETSTAERS